MNSNQKALMSSVVAATIVAILALSRAGAAAEHPALETLGNHCQISQDRTEVVCRAEAMDTAISQIVKAYDERNTLKAQLVYTREELAAQSERDTARILEAKEGKLWWLLGGVVLGAAAGTAIALAL